MIKYECLKISVQNKIEIKSGHDHALCYNVILQEIFLLTNYLIFIAPISSPSKLSRPSTYLSFLNPSYRRENVLWILLLIFKFKNILKSSNTLIFLWSGTYYRLSIVASIQKNQSKLSITWCKMHSFVYIPLPYHLVSSL